jgi:hypothetical protein
MNLTGKESMEDFARKRAKQVEERQKDKRVLIMADKIAMKLAWLMPRNACLLVCNSSWSKRYSGQILQSSCS